MVMNQLEKPQELSCSVRKLAFRHVQYGVQVSHYALVGSALLWALEEISGPVWNSTLASAWSACYAFMADTMIAAAYSPWIDDDILLHLN